MHFKRSYLTARIAAVLSLILMVSTISCTGITIATDDHVRLVSRTPQPLQDITFSRAFPDGSTQYPWPVPPDKRLVLTDFEYSNVNNTPGRSALCRVYADHGFGDPVRIPLIKLGGQAGTVVGGSNPIVYHTSLVTGIVVDTHDLIGAERASCGEDARLMLIGYLVDVP